MKCGAVRRGAKRTQTRSGLLLAFVIVVGGWISSEDASAQFRNNAFEFQAGYSGFGWTTDWANTLALGPSNVWGMGDQVSIGAKYVRIGGDVPFTSWDDLWAWYPVFAVAGIGVASPAPGTVQTGIQFIFSGTSGMGAKYYFMDEKSRPYLRAEVVAILLGPVDGTAVVPISEGFAGYGGLMMAGGYEHFIASEVSIAGDVGVAGLFTIFALPKVSYTGRLFINVYF